MIADALQRSGNRCGAGGWDAATGFDVLGTAGGVLGGVGEIGFGRSPLVFLRCLEQFSQVGTTPAAAGAGAEAIAHLAGALWFFDLQKVQRFSLGDVEAEAEFVVEVHDETMNDKR